MTRRLLVFFLSCLAAPTLLAQAKDMGPAAQYYKQALPKKGKFQLFTPPKKGGEVQYKANRQTLEKDEQAIFNLDTKTGTFFHASGSMEPAIYFTGEKLEKLDEEKYRLTNGILTSCDLDSPAW